MCFADKNSEYRRRVLFSFLFSHICHGDVFIEFSSNLLKFSVTRVNSMVFEFCSYCMIGVFYCSGYGLCTCLFLIIEALMPLVFVVLFLFIMFMEFWSKFFCC